MTDFYVYIHRKSTTGAVFYVGKGKDTRAFDTFDRGTHWGRTAAKHGYYVEIVESGLQEWYAFELEVELIAYHGRYDLGHGPLVNKTDGGEGVAGLIHSDASRAKMSASHNGSKHLIGRTPSAQARANMSASKIGNTNSVGHKNRLGKTNSPESNAKNRAAQIARHARRKEQAQP